MKPQPLMPLIHQALETNRVVGEETRVIINLINEAESATVHMDANRLFQVMSNLLSNAIKFSPAGGEVNVTARMDQNMVRVSVADQGPGIKHEFRRRIFQKFAQGDSSTTRNKGGTGLGLSISREIIQRMLGNLHFESVEGQGSTFYFELPLWNPTPVQITSVPDQPEHKTTKPRILVVEDDPDIAHLLGLILEHAGYASDIAPTGAQALNALQTRHYDAMTLDLLLPDSNGLELIRQIQRQPRTAKLPIIVVSGNMEDHRLAINDELSEVEWVTKPIDQSRLRRLLEDMLISAPNAPPQLARSLHSRNDPTSKRFME
jgi:CheY-like chemotaxis protein